MLGPDKGNNTSAEPGKHMLNLLTSALFVLALAGIMWVLRDHDPQWVSADGRRFIVKARVLHRHGGSPGRWQTVHGRLEAGAVLLRPSFTGTRSILGAYSVQSQLDGSIAGRQLFTLESLSVNGATELLAVRIKADSSLMKEFTALIPSH
jgi:hypothetical protein